MNDCAVFIAIVNDQGRGVYGAPPHAFVDV